MAENVANHDLMTEIAQLRSELTQMRHNVAHLAERADGSEQKLNKICLNDQLTCLRTANIRRELTDLKTKVEDNHCSTRGFIGEIWMWVDEMVWRGFPNAHHFCYTELQRIFPQGFQDVPRYRRSRRLGGYWYENEKKGDNQS
jgi:hypothetical protein